MIVLSSYALRVWVRARWRGSTIIFTLKHAHTHTLKICEFSVIAIILTKIQTDEYRLKAIEKCFKLYC